MSIKTILLCLNELDTLPQLLQAAGLLGGKFNAHIKGLYVVPAVTIYGAESMAMSPVMYDGVHLYFKDRLAKAREAFEEAMRKEGLTHDFQPVEAENPDIVPDILANARDVDLLILAARPERSNEPIDADMIERVVIGAGRPVLVIPRQGNLKLSFDDVVLGWDESREAARAVFDSLPLIRKASRVRICTINAEADGTVPGGPLAEALDRHGIKAETHRLTGNARHAGDVLLQAAKDFGSGLIVMGCYGHSRFTELVFGGATRQVLRKLDVPVLMSH